MGTRLQGILSRRVLRDLKSNFWRYLALLLLITLGMYMVVAMIGSAESIMWTVETNYEKNLGEDGQFGTFVPLSEEEWGQITGTGVTLEEHFSLDYEVGETRIRVMKARSQIDLFEVETGRNLEQDGEMLLEKLYAAANGLEIDSEVTIGSSTFTVVGIGSLPDYDTPFEKLSDASSDSQKFGYGLVTEADYEALLAAGKSFKTEDYLYAYRLNGKMTAEELQELLQSFELDRDKVTNPYFLDMLDELEETRRDIQEGVDELWDGSKELADGLGEIAEHNQDLKDAVDTLFDTLLEEANDSFAENEIEVVLKADTFEEQLDAMIDSVGTYSKGTRDSVRDLKETLQDLRKFKEGIYDYTDGVEAVRGGTLALHQGLDEIVGSNGSLQQGADALTGAIVQSINAQLAPYGIPELTMNNYGEVLTEQMLTMVPMLQPVKEQFDALKAFKDGVYLYTGYVAQAMSGSYGLWEGEGQLTDASPDLQDAATKLLDAMIEMVQEQLTESDISVTLNQDNFEAELDKLTASGGKIDEKLKKTLLDTKESFQDIREFAEGITEYTDAVQEAADGSRELADGVKELKDATDDMIEEYFTFDLDNLTSFLKKSDNPRIYGSYNDVVINKYAGIAAGIILMVLFTYVIAVFVIHNIEQESSIIGALYALGLKSRQLILHYLLLPVLVTFLGGATGCIIGMTPAGMDWMLDSVVDYYSFPRTVTVLPPYVLVYALIMPPVTAAIVNYFCISKKLRRTALSLLRNEQRVSRIREVKLGNHFSFATRFQIRQMLRESHSALAVIIGMYICLLIVVLSLDCYVMCENYRLAAVNETTYEYMYNYKYPTKEVPEGGTPAYAEGLKKEAYGYNLEVTILGITENNPYFDVEVGKYKNEIVVASAVAEKFQVKKGDKMVFTDEVNHRDYAFTVEDVVYMESAFYCFMDLDAMRELFGQEDDYYNVVFAGHALYVDAGRLYSTVTRENVMEACSIFVDMMKPMVSLLLGLSALIFVVVMYLMVKVMVDRSAFSIALVKIFGFRKREIRKLYLNGNFLLVAIGALICVPLAKLSVDAIYPLCISNIAVGMDLHFTWQMYVGVYMGVLLCYLIITPLLMRRIHKRVPAEILKNRE